jgi:2-polyprenyl-6-methoxyphenol hydroxylase-like FAD-dependent oxidoreductase
MTPTIVVVGACLASLATSLGLAKLGYKVELVERHKDRARQDSAFAWLPPNAIQALQELCPKAKDKILTQPIYFEAHRSHLFGWWMVRDALLEQVVENDKITLHLG